VTKDELLEKLNDEHYNLLALVQDFSKADFEQVGVAGDWTVKDVFAHLAFWNWEAVKAVEQVARDERPAMMLDVSFDEINAREAAASRKQPLHKVMDDFRRSQKSLASVIERASEPELSKQTPFKSGDNKDANAAWIVGGIIEHYQEHTAALKTWLDQKRVNE
jgi:hypothetical protein